MEPLLRGESSGGLRNRSRGIVRRSDAITYGSNYEKAAALIDLVRQIQFIQLLFTFKFALLNWIQV